MSFGGQFTCRLKPRSDLSASATTTGARGWPARSATSAEFRRALLLDNAGALVLGRDRAAGTARLHPAFDAFCRDWGVDAARLPAVSRSHQGQDRVAALDTSSATRWLARQFASFAELEAHLSALDGRRLIVRIHGTTRERPIDRFERDERAAMRPLPANPLPVRQRRVSRRVATDCFVDVDTIRYSVPHRLVRRAVEVLVGDDQVTIFDGNVVVASHRRSARAARSASSIRRTSMACGASSELRPSLSPTALAPPDAVSLTTPLSIGGAA